MNDGYYAKVLPWTSIPSILPRPAWREKSRRWSSSESYEVLPEDLAVCEFVDPSKNNIQEIIAKGIDLMLKEMA